MPNERTAGPIWTQADKHRYAKALELAFELTFERTVDNMRKVADGRMSQADCDEQGRLMGCITGATAYALHDVSRYLAEQEVKAASSGGAP